MGPLPRLRYRLTAFAVIDGAGSRAAVLTRVSAGHLTLPAPTKADCFSGWTLVTPSPRAEAATACTPIGTNRLFDFSRPSCPSCQVPAGFQGRNVALDMSLVFGAFGERLTCSVDDATEVSGLSREHRDLVVEPSPGDSVQIVAHQAHENMSRLGLTGPLDHAASP
jgi:hypothetical protein